jgi:D-glycero-alpha-D-manno-heptose-7-phosphate kinase
LIYRSKAPLRIGLAGGGTDVSPYTERFGGAIVNATINLFAHASIEPLGINEIILDDATEQKELRFEWNSQLPVDGKLDLLKGVYNHIHRVYGLPLTGFKLTTSIDTPPGSGLGTSSTLVVAIIGAFAEMLRLPLGEYDISRMAYEIERKQLGFAGGRQDQYAATFGGINFMEFGADDKVVVNPLRIRAEILQELENNLVLFFSGNSRKSGSIIRQQQQNVTDNNLASIEAMHQLKKQAVLMKEALVKGRLDDMGELFHFGFSNKKKMADGIANPFIEEIYTAALDAGATGGKISGAGGGGFMFFYCPANTRFRVIKQLDSFAGKVWPFSFTHEGLVTWTSN